MVKELISEWEEAIGVNTNDHLVKIEATHWNIPEGCVSIVFEHMNGGSLFVSSLYLLEHSAVCRRIT